ncbi:hypothetical protein CEXT_457941 [Caerostris extrusa]|uniref:Uncharacterized protein n=1 Tax=Caerostris extrusa TaxID=172846 RepID=A0AAV4T9X4_CAEEX|nr:hypothetical protein CEXT_457941 [Caerostris extrusa]
MFRYRCNIPRLRCTPCNNKPKETLTYKGQVFRGLHAKGNTERSNSYNFSLSYLRDIWTELARRTGPLDRRPWLLKLVRLRMWFRSPTT